MIYRSRDEISNKILESVMRGATRTKIMFEVSISSEQADEYLRLLQEHGLACEQKKRFYRITEKGILYLSKYDEIRSLIAPTNL